MSTSLQYPGSWQSRKGGSRGNVVMCALETCANGLGLKRKIGLLYVRAIHNADAGFVTLDKNEGMHDPALMHTTCALRRISMYFGGEC